MGREAAQVVVVDHVPQPIVQAPAEALQQSCPHLGLQFFQSPDQMAQRRLFFSGHCVDGRAQLTQFLAQHGNRQRAATPRREDALLVERLAGTDRVGHHEHQRGQIVPAQLRQREIGIVRPAVVERDQQRARRQSPLPAARLQHVLHRDDVVMAAEELQRTHEKVHRERVVRVAGIPARIGRIQHPVEHHDRKLVAIAY